MITIKVALYRDTYHGLRDTGVPDWPPSPRRVLGALIAGAYALRESDPRRRRALEALQRVAATPPPVIDTPSHRVLGLPPTYAPRTWLPEEKAAGGISKFLDLSVMNMDSVSRTLKPQDGVVLAGKDIHFYVDLDCDNAELMALDAAAAQVPYFGTSKSPADVSITASGPPTPRPASVVRWYPHAGGPTHGWQPNTVDWFENNYQRIFGDDPAVTRLPPIPATGFVWPLTYDYRKPESRAQLPTAQLTRAVPNNRIPKLMPVLQAQLAEKTPGWRLFPLTISHETDDPRMNGDGRCVGFGLRPAGRDAPSSEEAAVAERILVQTVALLPAQERGLVVRDSNALESGTWMGPTEAWYSVTPLRAFPDRRVVAYQLAAELGELYDAEVVDLQLHRTPRIRRDGRWSNAHLADGLDQWWAEVVLSKPIEGPLLLGAATDYGFGTFRPREKR